MTNADDRATLEKVETMFLDMPLCRAMDDADVRRHLAAFRSALQVPDAAQARREAIEECDRLCMEGAGREATAIGRGALSRLADRLRARALTRKKLAKLSGDAEGGT